MQCGQNGTRAGGMTKPVRGDKGGNGAHGLDFTLFLQNEQNPLMIWELSPAQHRLNPEINREYA